MPDSRRERKKQNTKEKIVKTAISLFHEFGAENTSMEQIAETADIAKGTLYNYFPEKGAIIADYWRREINKTGDLLPIVFIKHKDTRTRIYTLLEEILRLLENEIELYRIYAVYRLKSLNYNNLDQSMRSGLEELLANILETGQKSGEIRRDIPLKILLMSLENAFVHICFIWQSDPINFNKTEHLYKIINLFLEGAYEKEQ